MSRYPLAEQLVGPIPYWPTDEELEERRRAQALEILREMPLGLRIEIGLWAVGTVEQWRGRRRHGVRRRQRR